MMADSVTADGLSYKPGSVLVLLALFDVEIGWNEFHQEKRYGEQYPFSYCVNLSVWPSLRSRVPSGKRRRGRRRDSRRRLRPGRTRHLHRLARRTSPPRPRRQRVVLPRLPTHPIFEGSQSPQKPSPRASHHSVDSQNLLGRMDSIPHRYFRTLPYRDSTVATKICRQPLTRGSTDSFFEHHQGVQCHRTVSLC